MNSNHIQRRGGVGQCFANKNGAGCKIMQSKLCAGVCSFHQTAKALKYSQKVALKRLASLPLEQQLYIADRYYEGAQPWT